MRSYTQIPNLLSIMVVSLLLFSGHPTIGLEYAYQTPKANSSWSVNRNEYHALRNAAASRIREIVNRCASRESVLFGFIRKYPLTHEVSSGPGDGNPGIPIHMNHTKIFNIQKLIQIQIAELEAQKATALDEMRQGLRCSLCKKTKSEFERKGINFYDHVRDVKGVVEKPSEAEIAAKAREYDQQIDARNRDLKEISEALKAWSQAIGELPQQISNWNDAHYNEATAFQNGWNEEKTHLEHDISVADQALLTAQEALKRAKPSDKSNYSLRKAIAARYGEQLKNAVTALRNRYADVSEQGKRFNRELTEERDQLRNEINRLTYDSGQAATLALSLLTRYVTIASISTNTRSSINSDW